MNRPNQNEIKHLKHPFYEKANEYREGQRKEQILKGAAKYPEPFDPSSWTSKELLSHAMQENVDQGHYIYGLYEKIEVYEKRIIELENQVELMERNRRKIMGSGFGIK